MLSSEERIDSVFLRLQGIAVDAQTIAVVVILSCFGDHLTPMP